MIKYKLLVPEDVAVLVRSLHPLVKVHIKAGLKVLLHDPYAGKLLQEELNGLRSFRVKRYRIVYRFASSSKLLEIVAIGPRKEIYKETYKIIKE